MNRPKKDYYTKYWVIENGQYVLRGLGRYQEDLEKYCDELERALDKACALLTYDQMNAIPPKELLDFCMKDWKERLMKDE